MSVATLSPSSAFHAHHQLKKLGDEADVGQASPSTDSQDPGQALLAEIDMLLRQLMALLGGDGSSDGSASDTADDLGVPSGGGRGGSGGGAGGAATRSVSDAGAAPASGGMSPVSTSSAGPDGSGLSTAPQRVANTSAQSAQVAGQYMNSLKKDFGLTDAQAAGVVGNLWHESGGMNSGISQGGAIGKFGSNEADDDAHGIGIAQWGGDRAHGLKEYAATHQDASGKPLDPTSQAANYGFLRQELQGPYKGAIDAVKKTSNVGDATAAFANSYEQPADPQMQSRVANAEQALATVS